MGYRLTAQYVRLRSANRGNANNTWNVNSSGNVNNNNASNANRVEPIVSYSNISEYKNCIYIVKIRTQGAYIPC